MADVTVVGSINMDIVAMTNKYPNRGETIFGEHLELLGGGKGANQATACARLGKSVQLIGAVGEDSHGDILLESLQKSNVDTTRVKRVVDSSTGCAIITIDKQAENTMLVLKGANDHLNVSDIQNSFLEIQSKVLLVQMEVPEDTVIAAMEEAKKRGMFVILDPAPAEGITVRALDYADLIVPNLQETKTLTGVDVTDIESAITAARYLENIGVKNSIIKLAGKGSVVFTEERWEYIKGISVQAVDTVGAGDSFAGAIACAIADGEDIISAAKFATIVGALKVTKLGAQAGIPTLEEVNQFCRERGITHYAYGHHSV